MKKEEALKRKKREKRLEMQQALRGQLLDKRKEGHYKTVHVREQNVAEDSTDVGLFFKHLRIGVEEVRSRSDSGSGQSGKISSFSSPGQQERRAELKNKHMALHKSNSNHF